jgi:hypothetical protein
MAIPVTDVAKDQIREAGEQSRGGSATLAVCTGVRDGAMARFELAFVLP